MYTGIASYGFMMIKISQGNLRIQTSYGRESMFYILSTFGGLLFSWIGVSHFFIGSYTEFTVQKSMLKLLYSEIDSTREKENFSNGD